MKIAQISISRRYLVLVAAFALALYVVLPQFGDFKSSWHLLSQPGEGWFATAVLFTTLTYLAGAATYCLLAFRPLSYLRTTLLQFAAMFVNRILPGAVGALGTNYLYLKKNKHSSAQAASVVAVNNLLGFTGHFLLLALVALISGSALSMGSRSASYETAIKVMVIASAIVLVAGLVFGRRKLQKASKDVMEQLVSYRQRPWRLMGALVTSMTLTFFNVCCLYACAQALGVDISFAVALVVLTGGVGAGVATPTPGGLGGFEAGMVAVLIAYNVDSVTALATALLYRLISYWLVLLLGALALVTAQRRSYI